MKTFKIFSKKNGIPRRYAIPVRFLKSLGIVIGALFVLFIILNWIFPVPDKIEYSVIITTARAGDQWLPDPGIKNGECKQAKLNFALA
jgi:hypothetical protein